MKGTVQELLSDLNVCFVFLLLILSALKLSLSKSSDDMASQICFNVNFQNVAARIITYTKRTYHISPVLGDLHWLPVEQRLTYKMYLIVYKIKHDRAPKYHTDLIKLYIQGYNRLRSFMQELLQERNSKNQWGDRSLWVAAPILWNNLSCHVKCSNSIITFKKNL